jgi:uncharacterized protein (DUF488 family)
MLHVMQQVYTVGHSSQSIEEFIAQLQRHTVEVVADVRRTGSADLPPHQDLFASAENPGQRLEQAYARRARAIAYRRTAPAASAAK